MANIIFNGEYTYGLNSFSRDTTFNFVDDTMSSNAYMSLTDADQEIEQLGHSTITSLEIKVNNESIYALNNITAHITSLNESLMGDTMSTNLNISFN